MRCGGCGHENPSAARFCMDCGAPLEAEPASKTHAPIAVGDGRYRIDRLLGEGARKVVYAATDGRLGREVAIAVIKSDGLDDAGRHRIEREARAMARLGDHPNIVTVFDVGEDDGQPFIISELMPGGSIADVLAAHEDRRLSVDDALRVGEQVGLALAHAHGHGVVHRDLKPANIWIAADGAARLGDFGLAVETDRSRITSEGMVVGTVAYLAPEQAVGRAPDTRSDLYALGASLYEMLTGRPPFLGDDAVTVISQHLNTAPIAPSWHNAAISRGVEALLLRLLEKDPGARPSDANAVVEELRRLRAGQLTSSEQAPAAAATGGPPRVGAFGRFVGRATELGKLTAYFDETLSGRTRLLMLVGEPGIGKTRLAEELAVYTAVRGAQVCWGHCYEGELAAPYQPFVEALRAYVRERSDDELRVEMSNGAPEVATLVSELRARFPDLPPSPPLEGEAERLRLFDGVASFIANASSVQPIVLMLDDVHWADKPTLLLLQYLARMLRHERLLIVCTYRDVELDRAHPLAEMVAALRREHLYERILIRGLDRDEVKSFIEAVGEQETPDVFADTIHRETEGNPFFVAEILRNLSESGALSWVDGTWVGTPESVAELPEGVREVIGRRLSRLSDDCNRMLTTGAAMPGGFNIEVVGRVLDLGEERVLDLLDEALECQVVRERRDQPGLYEFNHALIRQTLYSELSTPRRVRLHRQILGALEELYASHVDPHLTELAYHAFQAAPGGDVHKAVTYATRAGERASRAAAHEEAARAFDLALQALELDDDPDPRERAELLLRLGAASRNAGQADGARKSLTELAEIGRALDEPSLGARAALVYSGRRFTNVGDDPLLIELLEEAAASRDRLDDALLARVLARLGNHLALVDGARHAMLAEEAVAAARRSGDVGALAAAMASQGYAGRQSEGTQARLDRSFYLEVARLAAEAGDVELQASSANTLATSALAAGDREVFEAQRNIQARLAEQSRSPFERYVATMSNACVATFEGRYDDAERLANDAIAIARRTGDQTNIWIVGALLLTLRLEQGRSAELEASTRRVTAAFPLVTAWQVGLAQILLDEGKLDEAAEQFERVTRDGCVAVGQDVFRTYSLAALAEIAARVADERHRRELYALLEPHAGTAALIGGVAYHGSVDRYLGLLDTTLGHHDNAITHHEAALVMHNGMRADPWSARSKYDLASALLARDNAGDAERALGLLNEALDTATSIGQTKLVQEVLTTKLGLQGIASGSSPMASIDVVAAGISIERPDLRAHAASDGRVTLLFSDIEGYTALNERLGDSRTQVLLRQHNELVHTTVTTYSGSIVKSAGDGFMVVFADPAAAIACAVAMQRQLDEHDFGTDAPALRVRIGLHAGEVIREGDDFFGRTVIVAARIAAHATGGEILVSEDIQRAVPDPTTCNATFGAAREVQLKGLTGTHRLHRIDW